MAENRLHKGIRENLTEFLMDELPDWLLYHEFINLDTNAGLPESERGECYPEQFDISFDFAPRMCENKMQDFCLFRKGTAERMCWKRQCPEVRLSGLRDKYCPVVLVSCGYPVKCQPRDCPIAQTESEDLCDACS